LAKKGKPIRQVGVLAFRRAPGGDVAFMLITSRETRRFTIPKGWQMKGKSDAQAAGKEAMDEAGVTGRLGRSPIGEYQYWKRLRTAFVPINVQVFAMEVEKELRNWRERKQRKRAWLTPEQAATLVDEPALSALLLEAGRSLTAGDRSAEPISAEQAATA
jgi:hypothetical protein